MNDLPDGQTAEFRERDESRRPLPPIGSFEGEMIRPAIGRVKVGDIGQELWIWPDSGEAHGLPWSAIGLIGQRRSLLEINWSGRELLLNFDSSVAALRVATMITERSAVGVPSLHEHTPESVQDAATPSRTPTGPTAQPVSQVSAPSSRAVEPVASSPHRNGVESVGVTVEDPGVVDRAPAEDAPDQKTTPQRRWRWVVKVARALLALSLVVVAILGGIALGRRLGSDGITADGGPRGVVILETSGNGDRSLGPFATDQPWRVLWENEGDGPLRISVVGEGDDPTALIESPGPGRDSLFVESTGSIELRVVGDGPWRVGVVERDPTGG